MNAQVFVEEADFLEGTINAAQREVEVVLIRPGWSANGRYYSREVLRQSAGLFENVKAFADHPTLDMRKRGEQRGVRDITGRYYGVTIGADGELRAKRKVYENEAGNAVWPVIMDSIENKTPYIGLSINAVGKAGKGTIEGKEGVIVEAITAANSVDDVTTPAAGGGFVSFMASADTLTADLLEAMSYEQWFNARPDFVESLKKQMQRERQTEAVRALKNDVEQRDKRIADLTEQDERKQTELDEVRAENARLQQTIVLEQAFRAANLPANIEKELRAEIQESDPAKWLGIVERARKIASSVGANRANVTGAGRRVNAPAQPVQRPKTLTPELMESISSPDELMRVLKQMR
jgi:hypothetical protein